MQISEEKALVNENALTPSSENEETYTVKIVFRA